MRARNLISSILVILMLVLALVNSRQVKMHVGSEEFKPESSKNTFSIHALGRGKQGYSVQNWLAYVITTVMGYIQLIPGVENLTFRNLEYYPLMTLKICSVLYLMGVILVIAIERLVVWKFLNLKDRTIFYKNLRRRTFFAYFLFVFFSDEEAFMSVADFFIFFAHFGIYSTIAGFREVFDHYSRIVMSTQVNHESVSQGTQKIEKILKYYKILKYILITFLISSLAIFSDVGKLRLYTLFSPGLVTLIDIYLAHENLYYKHKTSNSINESIITFSMNYCFGLNTLSMMIQVANWVKDFLLLFFYNGFHYSFSFIHMYYIISNLTFFINWVKEFEKFLIFHRNKLLITKKFKLKVYDDKTSGGEKEECGICLNYLDKARILPCGHQFHLVCLLQLIKSGYKKCPVWRAPFEEDDQVQVQVQGEGQGAFQNLNDMDFYGLEYD